MPAARCLLPAACCFCAAVWPCLRVCTPCALVMYSASQMWRTSKNACNAVCPRALLAQDTHTFKTVIRKSLVYVVDTCRCVLCCGVLCCGVLCGVHVRPSSVGTRGGSCPLIVHVYRQVLLASTLCSGARLASKSKSKILLLYDAPVLALALALAPFLVFPEHCDDQ